MPCVKLRYGLFPGMMKNKPENIEIPEVPIPRRILIAHKKAISVMKRAETKQKSNQKRVQIRNQK
jgi:hypothetical protein